MEYQALVRISTCFYNPDDEGHAISDKDGQREADEGNTRASERVVDGLVGSTVEQLTQVQEWGLTDEGLMSIEDWTYGSCRPSDTGWPTNQGRLGTLGLDLSDPQHKENSMKEPNPRWQSGRSLTQRELWAWTSWSPT